MKTHIALLQFFLLIYFPHLARPLNLLTFKVKSQYTSCNAKRELQNRGVYSHIFADIHAVRELKLHRALKFFFVLCELNIMFNDDSIDDHELCYHVR